jgi:soluble lytic murein transglycosylase-like protein
VAHLSNGFSISHLRHEIVGETARLYISEMSFVEVPAAQIQSYTQDDSPPPGPDSTAQAKTIDDHIASASDVTGVDRDFVRSVIQHESSFDARAVSRKGAQGLMQLMPNTAKQLGVKDSFDPGANIQGGSQYLRDLLVRYNGDAAKALAAYNAGPGAVDRYKGVPPYSETRHYVARVITSYNKRKTQQAGSSGSGKAAAAPKAAKSKKVTAGRATIASANSVAGKP